MPLSVSDFFFRWLGLTIARSRRLLLPPQGTRLAGALKMGASMDHYKSKERRDSPMMRFSRKGQIPEQWRPKHPVNQTTSLLNPTLSLEHYRVLAKFYSTILTRHGFLARSGSPPSSCRCSKGGSIRDCEPVELRDISIHVRKPELGVPLILALIAYRGSGAVERIRMVTIKANSP